GERQLFRVDFESDFTGTRQTRKIRSQAIAQTHHRVDGEIIRKPARLHDSRNELYVFYFQGTPEPASNGKIVTRLAAPARYRAPLFNKSNYAHGDGDWPGRAARLAADYADLKPLRSPAQPAIELFHPPYFGLFGDHKRNQRELRQR